MTFKQDRIMLPAFITVVLTIMLIAYYFPADKSEAKRSDGSSDYWYWETVTHDGHQYVKAHNIKVGCVVHSPDCPCLLKAEKQ